MIWNYCILLRKYISISRYTFDTVKTRNSLLNTNRKLLHLTDSYSIATHGKLDILGTCHAIAESTVLEWKHSLHFLSLLSWLSGRTYYLFYNLRSQFMLLSKLTDSTKIQKSFTLVEAEFHAVKLHVSNYVICINFSPVILDIHWSIYTHIKTIRRSYYLGH